MSSRIIAFFNCLFDLISIDIVIFFVLFCRFISHPSRGRKPPAPVAMSTQCADSSHTPHGDGNAFAVAPVTSPKIHLTPLTGTETAWWSCIRRRNVDSSHTPHGDGNRIFCLDSGIGQAIHLTPLTGTETIATSVMSAQPYRFISHPSRGRKRFNGNHAVCFEQIHLTPLTGTETCY